MNERGFYDAVAFIVFLGILAVFFLEFMSTQINAESRLNNALIRSTPASEAVYLELTQCNSTSKGLESLDLSNGVQVNNEGPGNVHDVSVYYVDRSGSVTKLTSDGDEEVKEIRAERNACFTGSGTTQRRDQFIVNSLQVSFMSEVT